MLSAEAGQVQRARLQPAKLCKAGGHRRELELTLVLPGIGKLPGLAQDRHGGTVVLCVFFRVKAVCERFKSMGGKRMPRGRGGSSQLEECWLGIVLVWSSVLVIQKIREGHPARYRQFNHLS